MKIKDIYQEKNTVFSCEVFPPRPDNDIETIYTTISELREVSPDFVSVTYSAGGETKERTIEISSKIKNKYNIESLMHLTCINSGSDDIRQILGKLKEEGIDNILALRGDIPYDKNKEDVISDFHYAADLVDYIKKHTDFCVGVAGYPESHPESPNEAKDIEYLKNKVDKGADFIITQLFFKNEYFYRFMDKIHSININLPVSAGIMPVFKAKLLKKIASLCGASIPNELQSLVDKYGHKPLDMEKAGTDYATRQILDLLQQNIDGLHIYTMNNARLAKKISRNTGRG